MVLHNGFYPNIRKAEYESLAHLNTRQRAVLSRVTLPQDDLDTMISSADIGLVFYIGDNVNERLTARSSEKVARYARCGVPMVSFDYDCFQSVFDEYQCGRCISQLEHLPSACEDIFGNYERYRQGAYDSYAAVYNADQHFPPLLSWLEHQATV